MNYMPTFNGTRRNYTRTRRPQNADHATIRAWQDANPVAWAWIERGCIADNEFATSLNAGLNRYGSLTDKQLAAVMRNVQRDAPEAQADRLASAPDVNTKGIEAAFANAREAGIKRPHMTFAVFKFKPAPATGRNPGAVYVTDRDTGEYYGMSKQGKFLKSRYCPADAVDAIIRTCADPHAEAIAHGKEFGVCCCCNRTLTDPTSIAKGIGPVCETNYGWGA